MSSFWPVTKPARSEARKQTASATSAATPHRDVGAGHLEGALVQFAARDQPVGHAVGQQPRPDSVGADAVPALFYGEGADEGLDGTLGHRREAVADRIARGGGRGDRDQAARGTTQMGKRRVCDREEAAHVDAYLLVEHSR